MDDRSSTTFVVAGESSGVEGIPGQSNAFEKNVPGKFTGNINGSSMSLELHKHFRTLIGLVCWLLLGIWMAAGISGQSAGNMVGLQVLADSLVRWCMGSVVERSVSGNEFVMLAAGDPVFIRLTDGRIVQAGSVRTAYGATMDPVPVKAAVVRIDSRLLGELGGQEFVLEAHAAETSLDGVVEALFSVERRQQIAQILARDWQLYGRELSVQFEPLLREGAAELAATVESELPKVLERHREDLGVLADRYQSEIVRDQIVPLVRKQVLPIIEEEVRPAALEIGRELWDRVSLWSFTWRYLYDVSPLPERNAVRSEFERFLQREIRPAIESRTDAFVDVTERIVARISRNEEVRKVVRESLRTAAADPQLQQVILQVFREAIIENGAVSAALQEWLQSEEVQAALQLTAARFEPTVREIGDLIFGSRESGISQEFARVLRLQILMKDRRWLMIVPTVDGNAEQSDGGDGTVVLRRAVEPMPYPLNFEVREQSPLTRPEPIIKSPGLRSVPDAGIGLGIQI